MGQQALTIVHSQSRLNSRVEKFRRVLFFPFIVEYLDFWVYQ